MVFIRGLAKLALALTASASQVFPIRDVTNLNYEYIVVGSGAGGGVVAARLALAGHSTLLIEAGDDQGNNPNYTVPAYEAKATEDPLLAWSFYVRHYPNDTQQELDYKLTYNTPGGAEYTGLDPPPGSTIKGILYPRTATLGGCTAHNALVFIYPDRSDFEYIVNITGDTSWDPDNMRQYFVKLEDNHYLPPGVKGHGYDGWLSVETAPLTLALESPQLFSMITGGANGLADGNGTQLLADYVDVLLGDANADSELRDQDEGYYQIPITSKNGARNGAREFVLETYNAKYPNGTKKYPLDLRLNCFVTKVTFDETQDPPVATGVEFLDGKALYHADSRSNTSAPGIPGSANASREVIVAGGSFNSPQILKLSGIGPREELERFNISVISDLPGVGGNLQDHYEVVVQANTTNNFTILDGCNFGFAGDGHPIPAEDDPCYVKWQQGDNQTGNADRGTYASSGFAAAMFIKTTESPDNNYDVLGFGGPVNFRGYFPGYSYFATNHHNRFSWALLKSHPRNTAGTLNLTSANPLDTPAIDFKYFNAGNGDYQADLDQIYQAIETARDAFKFQGVNTTELLPGSEVQTKEDVEKYIMDTAWGHHCSCTCAIGADDDPLAVLDSSFRVRGVKGLRVIDASVYPRIPGTFTAASTYLVGEKGAAVILQQLAESEASS